MYRSGLVLVDDLADKLASLHPHRCRETDFHALLILVLHFHGIFIVAVHMGKLWAGRRVEMSLLFFFSSEASEWLNVVAIRRKMRQE